MSRQADVGRLLAGVSAEEACHILRQNEHSGVGSGFLKELDILRDEEAQRIHVVDLLKRLASQTEENALLSAMVYRYMQTRGLWRDATSIKNIETYVSDQHTQELIMSNIFLGYTTYTRKGTLLRRITSSWGQDWFQRVRDGLESESSTSPWQYSTTVLRAIVETVKRGTPLEEAVRTWNSRWASRTDMQQRRALNIHAPTTARLQPYDVLQLDVATSQTHVNDDSTTIFPPGPRLQWRLIHRRSELKASEGLGREGKRKRMYSSRERRQSSAGRTAGERLLDHMTTGSEDELEHEMRDDCSTSDGELRTMCTDGTHDINSSTCGQVPTLRLLRSLTSRLSCWRRDIAGLGYCERCHATTTMVIERLTRVLDEMIASTVDETTTQVQPEEILL